MTEHLIPLLHVLTLGTENNFLGYENESDKQIPDQKSFTGIVSLYKLFTGSVEVAETPEQRRRKLAFMRAASIGYLYIQVPWLIRINNDIARMIPGERYDRCQLILDEIIATYMPYLEQVPTTAVSYSLKHVFRLDETRNASPLPKELAKSMRVRIST